MNSRDLTVVLLVTLGLFVLLPVLGMAFGGFGMMGPGHMFGRGMMGGGYGGGLFGWMGLLILALVVVGVTLIVRGMSGRMSAADQSLEILRQRLARGELTKEQYDDLKKVLS